MRVFLGGNRYAYALTLKAPAEVTERSAARSADIDDVNITRTMRGWTDHRLMRAKMNIRIIPCSRSTNSHSKNSLNTTCLQNPDKQTELQDKLNPELLFAEGTYKS